MLLLLQVGNALHCYKMLLQQHVAYALLKCFMLMQYALHSNLARQACIVCIHAMLL